MKRIIILISAIVLILVLTACGTEDSGKAEKETTAHTHTFSDATCTEPQKCSCGETKGEALGHTWTEANCTAPKTCSVCSEAEGEALGHTWTEANCTAPKTCSVCSEAEGEALGHTWTEANCTAPKTCSVCSGTEGEALGHTWVEATCTAPKTCSVCYATEGYALGHAWVEATCTTPKTCSVCYVTEGYALGHSWAEATCTTPKTCAVCYATEGGVVHTYENGICIYCNETKVGIKLDSKYYRIDGGTIHIYTFHSYGYVGLPIPWVSSQNEWTTDKCIYYKGKPYYQLTGIGGPAIAKFVVTDTEILVYNYSMSDGSLKNLSFKMSVNENGDLVITYSDSEYYKVGEVWLHSLD